MEHEQHTNKRAVKGESRPAAHYWGPFGWFIAVVWAVVGLDHVAEGSLWIGMIGLVAAMLASLLSWKVSYRWLRSIPQEMQIPMIVSLLVVLVLLVVLALLG
jgi:cell division protein FtsX